MNLPRDMPPGKPSIYNIIDLLKTSLPVILFLATIPLRQVLSAHFGTLPKGRCPTMNNPFIIFKNFIKRKLVEFLYPKITEISNSKFREAKQNAYKEILHPIIKMAYESKQVNDSKEFNKALALVWIYANKKVALKMDKVVSIINKPSRGNVTEALQEAIVEMRKDVQIWSGQKLKSDKVKHLYTRVIEVKKQN